MKKKTMPLYAVVLALAVYIYNSFLSPNNEDNKANHEIINQNTIVKVYDIPMQIQNTIKEGLGAGKYIEGIVTACADGDTIEVLYKNETHKVRLLCIDTPESVKQGVEPQPFSKEASEITKSFLLNKKVKLVFEKALRDRYGRLLAHVILEDGMYFNATLVRSGFARVEIVSPNSAHKDYFLKLQEEAVEGKIGLWGLPEDEVPFVKDEKGNYIPRYKLQKKAS